MADDIYKLDSSGFPDETHVLGFRGSEGISRPYAFEIFLTVVSSEAVSFDPGDAVNAKATLTMDRGDGKPPFRFNGILSEVSIIHEMDGRAIVRAVMVPRLWYLTQTLHSRIFTKQSLPEIIKAVLEDNGLSSSDYQLNLSSQYDKEEHVCQYRESDFDFVSRWMEREGMYYFFEQGDSEEKLIIADAKAVHTPLDPDPITFMARVGHDVSAGECLHTFMCRQKALPEGVKLRDYDFNKPALSVTGSASVSKKGLGEINAYGARFFSPDAGKRLAQTRAEDLLAREVVFTASGTARYLRAGYLFTLQYHPRSAFDAKYLATEVEHYGNQRATTAEARTLTGLDSDEVYRVDVTAIPSETQFRSGERVPWPRIYGTENGIVDGEAESPYAQLDDGGCYLVRFSFDENTLADGKASTRVRMMQPHGGSVEGFHFPLRKGTEVMITFLGGDPDRPFIAGVVPNAHKPSVVGSRNHTQNVIRTGGKNQLVMEDEQGKEFMFLSSPNKATGLYMGHPAGPQSKVYTGENEMFATPDNASPGGGAAFELTDVSLYPHTDGNHGLYVGGNSITDIEGNVDAFVRGNVSHGYKGTFKHQVLGAATEYFYATQTTNVTGLHHLEVTGPRTDHVTEKVTETYGAGREQTVSGGDNTCHWTTSATFDGPTLTETFSDITRTGSTSYTVNSTATTTTHLGHWTHDSGITGWTFGPLTVNSGTMTWTATGNVTVTWPNFTNNAASWFSTGMSTGTFYAFNLAFSGLNFQMASIAIAMALHNVGIYGNAITIAANNIHNKAADIEVGGVKGILKGIIGIV